VYQVYFAVEIEENRNMKSRNHIRQIDLNKNFIRMEYEPFVDMIFLKLMVL